MTTTQELLNEHKGLARLGYEVGAEIDDERLSEVLLSATRVELEAQTQAVEDLGLMLIALEDKKTALEAEKAQVEADVEALTLTLENLNGESN